MILVGNDPSKASDIVDEQLVTERFWGILLKNPRRGTTLDRVCDYYTQSGQTELLRDKADDLTQNDPDGAKAWLLAGLIQGRLGNDQQAVTAYQKAAELDMSDALAPWYLGETLLQQGELDRAITAFEQAKIRNPHRRDLLEIMQALGRTYERNMQRDQAAETWKELETLFPDDQEIVVRIAEILEEERQYDQSLVRYEKLAESAQKSGEHYAYVRYAMNAADLKIKLEREQEAIRYYEKLLDTLDDQNWLAGVIRDRVEQIFLKRRDFAGLVGYYENRRRQHPNDRETIRRLATALVRVDEFSKAEIVLQNALEKAPSDVSLRRALVDLHVRNGQFDQVDREYEKLDALEPNDPDHITQWGLAVLKNETLEPSQRNQKAARIWDKLVSARPDDAATHLLVADLTASHDMPDEAEKLYRSAVALAGNDATYLEYLALFYHRIGQKKKAVETFRRMTEGDRHTPDHLFRLADTLRRLDYDNEALAVMRESVALEPDHFEMQRTFLELLIDFKQIDQARDQLAKLEKLVFTDEQFENAVRLEIRLDQFSGSDVVTEKLRLLAEKPDPTVRELWKTAMFQLQAGQNTQALASMEKAMQTVPDSVLILEMTADLLAKNFHPERAIAVYETLMTQNGLKQQEYRKRIARIQLGTQYRDLGIETLRRIVRSNPQDLQSLDLLTKQLLLIDQIDETIELTWLAFDSLDDLQEKILLVTKLAEYHKQINRMAALFERLQAQQTADPAKRRETAYCLALVHVFMRDFLAARNILEERLHETGDSGRTDPSLLHQLSVIAQIQGDTLSAVRYQERLCEFSKQPGDRKRLLDLYCMTGNWNAAAVLVQRHTNLNAPGLLIEALDHLLEREAYPSARELLDKWESTFPDNWELLYRKLQICYRLNEGNPDTIADTIIGMNRPLDEAASIWKKTTAENASDSENRVAILFFSQGASTSASWWFGEAIDRTIHIEPGSPPSYTLINRWNHILLQTVFGECLQLKPGRDGTVPQYNIVPAKPLFKPLTFADAKFAATAWKMKTALDRDVVEYRQTYPGEVETIEKLQDMDDPDADRLLSEMEDNPNASDSNAFESRLASLVEQVRNSLPEDSQDSAILKERLRFEFFWAQWTFGSIMGNLPYSWFYYSIPQENHWQVIQKIGVQLALSGEKEFDRSAFRLIMESVEAELQLEFYRSPEIDAKINKNSEAYLNQMHEIEKRMVMNPSRLSVERRLDWLVEKLIEIGLTDPSQITKMPFHYSSLTNCFPVFFNLLEMQGRTGDIDRIEKMLSSLSGTGIHFAAKSLQSARENSLERDWLRKIGLAR